MIYFCRMVVFVKEQNKIATLNTNSTQQFQIGARDIEIAFDISVERGGHYVTGPKGEIAVVRYVLTLHPISLLRVGLT